jgi:hypothetical protein
MNCPRRPSGAETFRYENKPDDGTCDYCGSLDQDTFMARVEAGDVILCPTDKNYKVYVRNKGGAPFKQSYRTDKPAGVGEVVKDPMDQSHWTWTTREATEAKFYFYHLSDAQRKRFVELLNDKKLNLDYPGYFYQLPYFVVMEPKAK